MPTVRDIMTTTVRTMHRDTYVCEVERVFAAGHISAAPLIDDTGDIVGFVSKSDVTRFDSTGEDPSYARVSEIATPKVISIESAATIQEAAQKMLNENVHHLAVVESGQIVGILSSYDFVKLAASDPDCSKA